MTLIRVAPPAILPITLDDAKGQARIFFDDDDGVISRLIAAAVAQIDGTGTLGRAMITQDWAQWVSQSPGWVRLEMGPFQELLSVQFYDKFGELQTATLADFETRLQGDYVICKPKEDREWPTADTRQDAIKITYRVGYGDTAADVPQNLRHALLLLVDHWYQHRGASSESRLMPIPFGVDALIATERVSWYG